MLSDQREAFWGDVPILGGAYVAVSFAFFGSRAPSGVLLCAVSLPSLCPCPRKVVVLGSGWGAISFVKALNADSPYDVTLVSPRNYFLYTPLLPGAATVRAEEVQARRPTLA